MRATIDQRKVSYGFTLIEIMVVVLIIGLGIGIVSFTIGGNQPQALRSEARQLANQLEMVAGEAALGGEAWGLQFYRASDQGSGESHVAWRWLHFREADSAPVDKDRAGEDQDEPRKNKMGWQPQAPRDLDTGGQFSEKIEAVLEIEGREVPIELLADADKSREKKSGKSRQAGEDEKSGLQPDIWLAPGGEMTPFALHLNFVGENNGPVVRGDALGRIEVDAQNEMR